MIAYIILVVILLILLVPARIEAAFKARVARWGRNTEETRE
jgi:hypothetical protein